MVFQVHGHHGGPDPAPALYYGLGHQVRLEGTDPPANTQPEFDSHHDYGVLSRSLPWGGSGHNDAMTPDRCYAQIQGYRHFPEDFAHLAITSGQGNSIPLLGVQSPAGYIASSSSGRFCSCALF